MILTDDDGVIAPVLEREDSATGGEENFGVLVFSADSDFEKLDFEIGAW
jgi:hypothetical protein